MAMSEKATILLKQIYAYRGRGEEKIIEETPDEALEYVLWEIVDHLHSRESQSAPVDGVMRTAVGRLNVDRRERLETTTS